jgi:cobalt/nickel transport system permease protein
MHIPDGLLDLKTCLAGVGLSVAGVGLALHQARRAAPAAKVPLMGLTAAFIFAAQMVNFPVAGGTSGHLMGGVLAAVLLGPSAAILTMTAVLVVQCFMFADGGVMALGANVFNLAMVGPLVGFGMYRGLRSLSASARNRIAAAVFAGWFAMVAAAVSCAGQLAWSGIAPWSAVFPTMVSVHMVIGLGEGLITGLVLGAIARYRPEILGDRRSAGNGMGSSSEAGPAGGGEASGSSTGYVLLLLTGVALFISPFASPWPDGLERVAIRLGFPESTAEVFTPPALFPDYAVDGMGSAVWATLIAGGVGVVITYGLSWLLAHWLTRQTISPTVVQTQVDR